MTPEEFATRMMEIAADKNDDTEHAHAEADDLLCEALRELGYEEGVDIFEGMTKWYA